jgi:hypothetical protein
LAADETWQAGADTIPHEMMRPLVLRRQLEAVAAMTWGEMHPLATLTEALALPFVSFLYHCSNPRRLPLKPASSCNKKCR